MAPLSKAEREILSYIHEFNGQYKNSPTVLEIAERCKCTMAKVRYQLEKLDRKGYIQWLWVGSRRLIVPLYKA